MSLWPRRREADYGRRVGGAHGNRDYFFIFSEFFFFFFAVLVYRRWKQDFMPQTVL